MAQHRTPRGTVQCPRRHRRRGVGPVQPASYRLRAGHPHHRGAEHAEARRRPPYFPDVHSASDRPGEPARRHATCDAAQQLLARRSGAAVSRGDRDDCGRRRRAAYQAAEYAKLSALPATIAAAQQLVGTTKGADEVRVWRALARANLVASKLAVKRGDAVLASLTADRASTWAARLCDPVLISAAAYQLTCALTRSRDLADAERVAMTAHDSLARHSLSATAAALSVRGALLLQAAIVAALQGDHATARLRLRGADDLATQVGVDGNEVWTAFGPTNVLLHRLGVAIALGEHARAIQVGRHIDTTTMPAALRSRRAQVHLDLAAAHGRIRTGAAQAVLHLLEAERLAPQVIGTNVDVRVLILFLLHGERRSATPGLRALAQRGGVIP